MSIYTVLLIYFALRLYNIFGPEREHEYSSHAHFYTEQQLNEMDISLGHYD